MLRANLISKVATHRCCLFLHRVVVVHRGAEAVCGERGGGEGRHGKAVIGSSKAPMAEGVNHVDEGQGPAIGPGGFLLPARLTEDTAFEIK